MKIWAVVGVMASAVAPVSHALAGPTFNFIQNGTVPANVLAGFQAAADRWSGNFTEEFTVNLSVAFVPLSANVIGSAGSSTTTVSYSQYRSALAAKSISADDISSLAGMQTGTSFPVYTNYTTSNPNGSNSPTPWTDDNGSSNNTQVTLNIANARALNLWPASDGTTDAVINFSSNFAFDFDPRDGITPGQIDFQGIAAHEIGHALGFVSGVDALDTNTTGAFSENSFRLRPLDLFRYSAPSTALTLVNGLRVNDFTAGTVSKFFSVNGGASAVTTFSTGQTVGDGRQASHWRDNLNPIAGIMDPTAQSGETLTISENDRRAFDVIGYTRDNTWEWNFQPGGVFSAPLNWNANGVPSAAQDAVFDLRQAYGSSISFTDNATVRDLIVAGDTLVFSPNLATRTVTVSRNLIIGNLVGSNAVTGFTLGTLTAPTAMIGAVAGATGALNASGSASVTVTGALSIGLGSSVSATGANTRLSFGTLTNSGSVTVGSGASASLGTVTSSGTLMLAGTTTASRLILTGGTVTATGANITIGSTLGQSSTTGNTSLNGTGTLSFVGALTLGQTRIEGGVLIVTSSTLNWAGQSVTQSGTSSVLSAGALNLTGSGTWANGGGSPVLRNQGVLSSAAGVRTIEVQVVNTGVVQANSGTTTFSGGLVGGGQVTVAATGRVVASVVNASGLQVAGRVDLTGTAANASVVDAISITNNGSGSFSGRVDLGLGALVVRNGDLAGLRDAARAGWNAGAADGNGLMSSLSAEVGSFGTVAVFSNLALPGLRFYDSFGGIVLTATDVVVRYTYLGDTNIDGRLDGVDLVNILEGISAGLTGWQNGDINYDGVVDASDYNLFAPALLAGLSPLATGQEIAGGFGAAIPEPTSVAVLAALLPLVGRRRR